MPARPVSHKKDGHIDFMFLSPSPTRLLDPLLQNTGLKEGPPSIDNPKLAPDTINIHITSLVFKIECYLPKRDKHPKYLGKINLRRYLDKFQCLTWYIMEQSRIGIFQKQLKFLSIYLKY